MKKFLIIALVAALALLPLDANAKKPTQGKQRTTATTQRKPKRAFMVGISNYRANGRDAWSNIHGAEDVAILKPVLAQQGFAVTSLTNEDATYANIKKKLTAFVKNTRKGDIVYLHFSAHGQPVEDGLNGMKKDEADGWDESIVPIDAGSRYQAGHYVGDKHLTDDELEVYFEQLRKKIGPTGALYVVVDACHAGEVSKGVEGTVRGSNEGLSRSGAVFDPRSGDRKRHYDLPKGNGLAPTLFLEACTSQQRNHELRIDGNEVGSLSYNVKCALQQHPLGKNVTQFKTDVQQSTQQPGRWPSRQTLVVEE